MDVIAYLAKEASSNPREKRAIGAALRFLPKMFGKAMTKAPLTTTALTAAPVAGYMAHNNATSGLQDIAKQPYGMTNFKSDMTNWLKSPLQRTYAAFAENPQEDQLPFQFSGYGDVTEGKPQWDPNAGTMRQQGTFNRQAVLRPDLAQKLKEYRQLHEHLGQQLPGSTYGSPQQPQQQQQQPGTTLTSTSSAGEAADLKDLVARLEALVGKGSYFDPNNSYELYNFPRGRVENRLDHPANASGY